MSSKNDPVQDDPVLKLFEYVGLIFTGPFIIALWAWAWSWYLLSGFDFRVGQQSKTADSIIIKRIKAERMEKETHGS